jgi:predicted RNA-binding Zn ribbon-like protein
MSKLFSKSISMLCRRFSLGNIVWNLKYLLTDCLQDSKLIAPGDLALIRKCESDKCVLWFYDTTKGHKRRWCSMATCGNRHKIRKFRAK